MVVGVNTNLTTSVEQLIQRRADLLREVSQIDTELERVKLALQGAPSRPGRPIRTNYRRDIRVTGSVPNDIYAALAIREPRSVKDLAAHIKVSTALVSLKCKAMTDVGRLHRVRPHNMGRTYVYARTAEALITTAPDAPPASDDELGIGGEPPVTTDADTSSSERDTSHV